MRVRLATVVLVLFFLAACTTTKPTLQPEPTETPLFTDADLDGAKLGVFSTASVDASSEVNALTGGEVDKSDEIGELTTQAVLPGAKGIIAYIRYTPTATNPYSIILFDQATDVKTTVYSGNREIDSVAVDSLGTKVVFSLRQTTSTTSDFEIYQLVLNPRSVTALTNNTSDDTNVSMSADASFIAWEGLRATTSTRQVQWLETATSTLKTLNSSVNDTMPSISGNSAYLAFIRTLSTGVIRVQVYQISTATLTTVISNTTTKRHPSVTDDNSKVAWTDAGTTTRVYVQDIATGIRTVVVANANGIEHAHLRRDGKFLTFGLLENGRWQLYNRDLTTNTSIKGISSTTADAKGMFWQWLAAPPLNDVLPILEANSAYQTLNFDRDPDLTDTIFGSYGNIVIAAFEREKSSYIQAVIENDVVTTLYHYYLENDELYIEDVLENRTNNLGTISNYVNEDGTSTSAQDESLGYALTDFISNGALNRASSGNNTSGDVLPQIIFAPICQLIYDPPASCSNHECLLEAQNYRDSVCNYTAGLVDATIPILRVLKLYKVMTKSEKTLNLLSSMKDIYDLGRLPSQQWKRYLDCVASHPSQCTVNLSLTNDSIALEAILNKPDGGQIEIQSLSSSSAALDFELSIPEVVSSPIAPLVPQSGTVAPGQSQSLSVASLCSEPGAFTRSFSLNHNASNYPNPKGVTVSLTCIEIFVVAGGICIDHASGADQNCSSNLPSGQRVRLSARVLGSIERDYITNSGVNWKIKTGGGSLSSSGGQSYYSAPYRNPQSGRNVTLVAESKLDPSVTAELNFHVNPISINSWGFPFNCGSLVCTLDSGSKTRLSASIINDWSERGVTWSIESGGGQITKENGNDYFVSNVRGPTGPSSITLKASSISDPSKSWSKQVSVIGFSFYSYPGFPAGLIEPGTYYLAPNETVGIYTSFSYAGELVAKTVTIQIVSGGGSLVQTNGNWNYTAPNLACETVNYRSSIRVRSDADPTKSQVINFISSNDRDCPPPNN